MKRKHSPLHDKWHRRVEGQIRHTMRKHPEYFNPTINPEVIINSLAKRIVGEIVAASMVATITAGDGVELFPVVDVEQMSE